jgi:hypothetical protein
MQAADVLIGIHGAGMANAWFMRPGSAVIEIHFPRVPWSVMHDNWNKADPGSQLMWFLLYVNVSGELAQLGLLCANGSAERRKRSPAGAAQPNARQPSTAWCGAGALRHFNQAVCPSPCAS